MIPHKAFLAAMLFAVPLFHAPALMAQDQQKANSDGGEHSGVPPRESFLITLTLKITDHGKITSDQSYTLAVLTRSSPSFVRDGDRVPVVTGAGSGGTQVQYVDTGTNIDVSGIERTGSLVNMEVRVENSGAVPDSPNKSDPVLRSTHYSMHPAVPLEKTTTVYSSSDATTGHKVEIQILAQPLGAK